MELSREEAGTSERAAAKGRSPSKPLGRAKPSQAAERDPFLRAANEDDDGYDPYSDRPAAEPLYERDPWN